MFKRLLEASISAKFMLIALIIVAMFVLAIFLRFVPEVEDDMFKARQASLVNMSDMVFNLIKDFEARAAKGELSREQAQKQAKELIRAMRYGQNDYFWINDDKAPVPVMIMHPTVPSLEGKVLDSPNFVCATGLQFGANGKKSALAKPINLFSGALEVCRKNGEGFVNYLWYRPSKDGVSKEAFPKTSFVRLYEPWGWIVGTGVYYDDIAAEVSELRLSVGLVTGIILLVAMCLSYFLVRFITRPVGSLVALAHEIASGNLSAKASGSFHGEMAGLKSCIEDMLGALKGKIEEAEGISRQAKELAAKAQEAGHLADEARLASERALSEGKSQAAHKLEDVVERMSEASREISSLVEQSSEGAGNQNQRIEGITQSMERMNDTVYHVSENAERAAQSSEDSKLKARQGAQVVAQAVSAIGAVREQSEELKLQMEALEQRALEIGRIMNVIGEIADQTNLLALNAAIEAARAGESGRGFAVVADEVRKLAEKTMSATQEVGQAISGIQEVSKANAANVDQAARKIAQATDLANSSGEALTEILRLAELASAQVDAIAKTSQEQSKASKEITAWLEDVRGISLDTVRAMSESSRAVNELSEQAEILQEMIKELKSN